MPRVSVIIPTYNRSELLVKAVASVLDQSFSDFELLVIDDCSPDDTRAKIEGIGDSRVAYFRNPENKGVSGSRNFGIERSRGEFIAFLDDDDEWLPGKLQRQVDILDGVSTETGLVYTGVLSVDLDTGSLIETVVPRHRGKVLDDLVFSNFIPTSSVLVRKECFTAVGLFDESLAYGEDFDLWIRISSRYSVDYIEEPLVIHKDHPRTTTANNSLVAVNVRRILEKHSALFASNKKGLSNYLLKIGTALCHNGELGEGRKAILGAIKAYPGDPRLYYNLALTFLGPGMYRGIKKLKYEAVQTLQKYTGRG